MQNKNIKIPYGERGVNWHNHQIENTSLLSWMEGWADFVSYILDAVYYLEDNEYGEDSQKSYENNEVQSRVNNGLRSEYNISTALYDLWDGVDKNLPSTIPGENQHGWDDSNPSTTNQCNEWETIDDVSLTLSQICAPLKTVTNSNKLDNLHCVQQYIDSLIPRMNTCQKKRDVIRVFRENRVVWNITDYNAKKSIGNESSDGMFTGIVNNETGYFYNFIDVLDWDQSIIPHSWTDNYRISSLNESVTNNWLYFVVDNNMHYIIDDYLIGYQSSADSKYTNAYLFNLYQGQTGYFSTCGDDNIINVRYGKLILGYTDDQKADFSIEDGSILMLSGYGSELTINDGSVLRIKSGGTLMVDQAARINIYGSGHIEVEDGAYICIGEKANIYLYANNSIINIDEDAIVGINPIHSTYVGSCSCAYPCDITLGSGSLGHINCPCGFGDFDYYNDYVVSSSVTLSWEIKKFKQNVIIPNGVTLTLNNSTFEMNDNKSIIINAGGKLVVDNSTITNSSYCPDKMWKGIRVLGNKNQRQLAQYQGTLEIKNGSVIANAKDAISTWDGDDYNTTGGIVKCTNSTFLNNRRSAEFMAYTNHDASNQECSNVSYFTLCNFIVNDNNMFEANNATFGSFITMWGVNGIKLKGCTFDDQCTTPHTTCHAIGTADAGYSLTEYCSNFYPRLSCNCLATPVRSSVKNVAMGVDASNSGTNYAPNINRTDFDACGVAAYISAINSFRFTENSIKMFSTDVFSAGLYAGLYMETSSGYKVEGNDFYSVNSTYPSNFGNIGIMVSASGNDYNAIYRNTFDKLNIGIWSGNNNGLQFQCNDFSSSFDADLNILSGISPVQGSSAKSAGNKFTSGVPNISTFSSNALTYYYSGTNVPSNSYYPASVSSNVTLADNSTANDCSSTLCNIIPPINPPIVGPVIDKSAPSNDDISLYESFKQIYESRLADYDAAGYDFLLENFEEGDADIVAVARLMQDTLVSIRRAMAEIANRNIDAILQDTIVFDRKSLNGWYNRINTQTAKYSLVNSYFEMGEYALARQELATIPQRFVLTADELAEYDNFCQYQSLREAVYADGRNYAQLTEDEIAELQRIVERNTGVSSAYANSVLCFFYGICRDEEIDIDFDIDAPMNSKSTTEVVEENAEPLAIYVYPNPADEDLNILLNSLPEGRTMIEFHDVAGRLMFVQEITSTDARIDISSLPQGVYMYRIVNDGNVIARNKIVKE